MVFHRTTILVITLLVMMVSWTLTKESTPNVDKMYAQMHKNYDELGNSDGFVSYPEIKRALAGTPEEDWQKEIVPHDDGDNLLTPTEFKNWLTSFKKEEL